MRKKPVVTIDGPAGAGKSTISKLIAARFSFFYLDTGALYRALAYLVDERPGEKTEESAAEISRDALIEVGNEAGVFRISANGRDVSTLIRTEKIGLLASKISAIPAVRKNLLDIQRRIGAGGGVVAEGRDMGTVVFPEAEVKFYLEASVQERARRRHRELIAKGELVNPQSVEEDIKRRDRQDSERTISPLVIPVDAVVIDTTDKAIDEIVEIMALAIERHLNF
ncbi:MAG: (d)CMP kinase [Syntrophobacterales bacterium]|nr:(d)CMP kinase [Syntrophobacterales bacterium]